MQLSCLAGAKAFESWSLGLAGAKESITLTDFVNGWEKVSFRTRAGKYQILSLCPHMAGWWSTSGVRDSLVVEFATCLAESYAVAINHDIAKREKREKSKICIIQSSPILLTFRVNKSETTAF